MACWHSRIEKGKLDVVRFKNVGLTYGPGPEVLRDITFHIPPGQFSFVTGPSGAGKSTLLKMMYMALKPTQGEIELFGISINKITRKEMPKIRRKIGVVFQDFRLLNHLNIFENVALPLRIVNEPEERTLRNVRELLYWVGLGEKMYETPHSLSGGEKQRVAIARAVITKPSLLLADEPTGNVDDKLADRLIRLFEELYKTGTSVVVATHNDRLVGRFPHNNLKLIDQSLTFKVAPKQTASTP